MTNPPTSSRFQLAHTAGVAVSNEELLHDMKRVASDLGSPTLTSRQYQTHGKYSHTTVKERFGSWNKGLAVAELAVSNNVNISDDKLFENILRVWMHLGRQPRKRELVGPVSAYSEGPYARRFGSWRRALEQFVAWAEIEGAAARQPILAELAPRKRTPRDPNDRLRFLVMRRDRFTCRHCGRSPARDPSMDPQDLVVDHVEPWAKGGETTLDNLQALCSRCNLGKGDESERTDA
jgi:hypothetical protein